MVASLIGTTIEWYDFFLYGTAVALVFNRLSFPTLDPLAGTLSNDGLLGPNFRSSMRALTAPNTASAPKRRAASQA